MKLRTLLKQDRPLIMGVLNVTPDSFSDGGDFYAPQEAIKRAFEMIEQGADIIDIGGESTRPYADIIPPEDEQKRVLPVIHALRDAPALRSIDTRNAFTMRAAYDAGADIINDVSGLTYDPDSMNIAAQTEAHIVVMHAQGTPQNMQDNPHYNDVVADVHTFFKQQIALCQEHGIDKDRLILDVGIGFGKTLVHNLALLAHLKSFADLDCPLMLGTSRKSFIRDVCADDVTADMRLGGSLASALWGVENGVKILRVHDVFETRQAVDVFKTISEV